MALTTVTVDTSNFSRSIRGLSEISGAPIQSVLLSETGHILERCVQLTTREKADRIERSVEFHNRTLKDGSGKPIIYITKSGVSWFLDDPGAGNEGRAQGRIIGGKTFHPMTELFHYGDQRWLRYQEFLNQLKAKHIDFREVIGRVALSWVQIGESLGIDVPAPGYVKNAPPFRGRAYVDGSGQKIQSTEGFFLEIRNRNPVLLSTIDGFRVLQTAISGRAAYFDQNLRRGVFNDLKERASRYPGVFVT
jgi:hypothetical protein